MKKLLIIENERSLARYIALELQEQSYEVELAFTAAEGLRHLEQGMEQWDIILLALLLKQINGIELCRKIREQSTVPIMMMTSDDSICQCVQALEAGADDYLIKPFAIEELLARLSSLFRRIDFEHGRALQSTLIRYKDLVLDEKQQTVQQAGQLIDLTGREYELLHQLMLHAGQLCSRDRLVDEVWGFQHSEGSNVVDVYVRYLRNKLNPADPYAYIQTIRGKGYMMSDS